MASEGIDVANLQNRIEKKMIECQKINLWNY